jgi:flagellar hook-associated protein 3 FlgL
MLAASTLRNINKAAARLAEANEVVSSGQKIQQASDDPVVATRAITYRSYVSKIAQYQDNVDAATGWQDATDSALSDLSDVIQQVQELATQAASDTLSDSDRSAIATEVTSLRDQAISIMNSTYAGRYIFGGYSTSEAPYALESTDLGDTVTFKGDYLSLGGVVSADLDDEDIETAYTGAAATTTIADDGTTTTVSNIYEDTGDQDINYNIDFNTKITVNTEGQDVIGSGASNLFATFDKLLLALNGDTSYKTATADVSGTVTVTTEDLDISSLLTDLDTDYDRMLTAQATLGARMDHVNSVSDSLDDAATAYAALKSDNEDADSAAAITEESSAEYAYEAALSVGAKVISKTLIDYIT